MFIAAQKNKNAFMLKAASPIKRFKRQSIIFLRRGEHTQTIFCCSERRSLVCAQQLAASAIDCSLARCVWRWSAERALVLQRRRLSPLPPLSAIVAAAAAFIVVCQARARQQQAKMPQTFFVTDDRMLKHTNDWDATSIEKPERLATINEKLRVSGRAACRQSMRRFFRVRGFWTNAKLSIVERRRSPNLTRFTTPPMCSGCAMFLRSRS